MRSCTSTCIRLVLFGIVAMGVYFSFLKTSILIKLGKKGTYWSRATLFQYSDPENSCPEGLTKYLSRVLWVFAEQKECCVTSDEAGS